ncbi:MAG: AAA family ATPase [bacterium]
MGKKSGILKDIKELSRLSNEVRLSLMRQAKEKFRNIISHQIYETLLVDSHFSVYENKKLVKAIDDEDLELYTTFILVEVPIDLLHERISQDNKERTRESCDKEKIQQHGVYERTIAEDLKQRCNIALIEIENIDLERTIEKIQEKTEE